MNNDTINYDKITDTIYWLSLDTSLKFNVSLAKKNKDGSRRFFHREVEYDSNYTDKHRVSSIKREFNYYLSFEVMNNQDCFTMIRVQDIILFRIYLDEITKWFSNLFSVIDGRLIVGQYKPIIFNNLAMGKTLQFEPLVLRYNEIVTPGIRITFLPSNTFTDVSVDKFMGLVYHIKTIDMHMVALAMINYLEAPPSGTNIYSFTPNTQEYTIGTGVSDTAPRVVKPINQQSFFSRMKDLE